MGTYVQAADYYVSPTGSDKHPGTRLLPFATISHSDSVVEPGDIVHVTPGVYSGDIVTIASGTALAHIRFVSDIKWGAKIFGGGTDTIWWSKGAYVDIVGFEIEAKDSTKTRVGLYLTGSYSSAQKNHVHDIHTTGPCIGQGAAGIESEGYYFATNMTIRSNLVHNVGPVGCRFDHGIYVIAPYTRTENNIVYKASGFGIHAWHDASRETIVNNTLLNNGGGVLIGGGDYYHTPQPSDHNVIANNIVVGNEVGFNESGKVGANNLYTNNLVYGNGVVWSRRQSGSLIKTLYTDPIFLNAGSSDYRLQSSSPAIDAADPAYSSPIDFDDISRPQGAGYDIGAYEYVGPGGR
jgi:hypothetical protein